MTETIDMTPEGCKTPEGRAKVNAAMEKAEKSRAALEMATVMFFGEHLETVRYALKCLQRVPGENGYAALDDLDQDVVPLLEARREAHNEFLRAVAGR